MSKLEINYLGGIITRWNAECDPKNPTELQMHERNIHEEGRGKVPTYVTLEMSGECKTMGKRNGT